MSFGWVAQGMGPFPLELQVSGDLSVLGILDVSGAAGEAYLQQDQEASHEPGNPGAASLGGFAGGIGGSATFTVGGTREKAQSIVDSQASREERLRMADLVIRNDADLHSLDGQVERLHHHFLQIAHGRRPNPVDTPLPAPPK